MEEEKEEEGDQKHSLFCNVVQHHVDILIEASQRSHYLFVPFHDDPYFGPNALVHQFLQKGTRKIISGTEKGKGGEGGGGISPSGKRRVVAIVQGPRSHGLEYNRKDLI